MNYNPPGSSVHGFPRQEYWSGLPFPFPGYPPDPGIKPGSPALQTDSLLSEPPGKLRLWGKPLGQSGADLNQIHYEYRVEVMYRFKGLDLVNKTPEKLWTEVLEEH